jgi:hypothetical protein
MIIKLLYIEWKEAHEKSTHCIIVHIGRNLRIKIVLILNEKIKKIIIRWANLDPKLLIKLFSKSVCLCS